MISEYVSIFPSDFYQALSEICGLDLQDAVMFSKTFPHSIGSKIYFGNLSRDGANFLRLRHGFKAATCARLRSLVLRPKTVPTSDIFYIPSRNGFVVIDLVRQLVFKGACPLGAEPELLTVEKRAFKAIPKAVPRLITQGKVFDKYSYVCWEYINPDRALSFADWPKIGSVIIEILFKEYATVGIRRIVLGEYVNLLMAQMTVHAMMSRLNDLNRAIFDKGISLIKELFSNDLPMYQVHAHGDLVPNNVIVSKNQHYLIDWANGGYLNGFYDLMIQEFYVGNSKFWGNFTIIKDFSDARFFRGIGFEFVKRFQELTKKHVSTDQIKASIVISLLELALKNHRHYQHYDIFEQDGRDMLTRVQWILEGIR